MASRSRKGKTEVKKVNKLRRNEVLCNNKPVDLKRFAYEVLEFSASKFSIPESLISKWGGLKNDYGCSDFISVVYRLIFKTQTGVRYIVHNAFKEVFELCDIQSFQDIGCAFQFVMGLAIEHVSQKYVCDIALEVEVTLAVACELVLFFYSINSYLYLHELADYWFGCYKTRRDQFKKEQAMDVLYARGKPEETLDRFSVYFIKKYCRSYEKTIKEEFRKDFLIKYDKYKKLVEITEKSKEKEVGHYSYFRTYTEHKSTQPLPILDPKREYLTVQVPELEGATGTDKLENPGLGIRPHEELLWCVEGSAADTTPFQNIPEITPRELARQRRRASDQRKRQKHRTGIHSAAETDQGQLSLESSGTSSVRQPSESVSDDPPTSQKNLGARPKVPLKHRRGLSGQQSKPETESSFLSSVQQALEHLRLDPSGTK